MKIVWAVWVVASSFVIGAFWSHVQAQQVRPQLGGHTDATPVFGPPVLSRPATPAPAVAVPAPSAPAPAGPAAEQKAPPPIVTKGVGPAPTPVPKPTAPPSRLGLQSAAAAQPPAASAAEKTPPSPLVRGPSLYETGRVGQMRVSEGGVQIGQTRKPAAMPQELRVQAKTNEPRPSATTAPGAVVNPAVLKREIRSRFRLLKDCPREVARNRRVALDAISASRLTLRWTILPGGQVADTQVVATAPTDGRVMNCVKREMSQWSFSAPSGGAVRVERDFSFRAPAAVTVPREKP